MKEKTGKPRPISKQLIGALTGTFTLLILANGDAYGYDIVQRIKKLADRPVAMKEAAIYPILKKYEQKEYIKSYWNKKSERRPRKYFKIMDKGLKALQEKQSDYQAITEIYNQLWK